MGLSAKELAELNAEEISPQDLAELNDPMVTSEVGPFASGYKMPPAEEVPAEGFSDGPLGDKKRTAGEHTRSSLERQRRDEGLKDKTNAFAVRGVHNASAGYSDEAKGVLGGARAAIQASADNMAHPDPAAMYDEFGIPIGGAASAAVAGGYTGTRDEDRADQAEQRAKHPVVSGLADVASAASPDATVRLAAQGLGDSEATTAVGLGRDTAKGLGAAVAGKLLGWTAAKGASKVGAAVAAKAAPEAEEAPTLAARAKAAMTPETLRNVRAEQAIQEGVRVNGRKLGEIGVTRVNGAPIGRVPSVPGGKVPELAAPVGVPTPAPKAGPGIGTAVRDLAAASLADYAVAKVARKLDVPYGGPLITAVVAARKATAKNSLGSAVADLVAEAHKAGLDAAGAKLIAEQLSKTAGTAFLDHFLTANPE